MRRLRSKWISGGRPAPSVLFAALIPLENSWHAMKSRLTLTVLSLLLFSVFLFGVAWSTAQTYICWATSYGGLNWEEAWAVEHTSDGGHAVIGWTQSFGWSGCAAWVLKLREDGAVQWQKSYGGPEDDQAVFIQQTTDGGYVVAGETKSFGAGSWDVWILKLDGNGVIQWQKTFGGSQKDTTSAEPIQQTTDGGYVVTGRTKSFGAGDGDFWVLKLDENGAIQWQRTYGGPEDDYVRSIKQTSDGGYPWS
jgi:hypothetical protein